MFLKTGFIKIYLKALLKFALLTVKERLQLTIT